jgi:hypothetical protein
MPCSFGLFPHRRSGTWAQPTGLLEVTVTVRQIPLVTTAYGTRVARAARTTTFARGGNSSELAQKVRALLEDHCLVGKSPEGSRQYVAGDSNSASTVSTIRGQNTVGAATCGFYERSVTAPVRGYPRSAFRLQLQRRPTRVYGDVRSRDAFGAPSSATRYWIVWPRTARR